MDRFEPNLRIPGPTALPPSVRQAGARQMINHRGPEFAAMLDRILSGMKPFFGTNSDVAMLTCAGSGGLEAAVVNTLSPGDRVLGVSIGSFGDRFAKIAGIYGADVTKIAVEWGQAADPAVVRDALAGAPGYRAVLLTHNETSTGVMNPIAVLAAAIRDVAPDTLILVDSVSGLGAVPFEMDEWGVDVVVTGSQKAWMAAPGLAMIAASARAWEAMETARMPRFYLDLRAHRDAAANGETPFTPAIAVVFQVDEGIRLMTAEGPASIFARHEAAPPRRGPASGTGVRALRRPALRVSDGDGGEAARGSRLEGVQYRDQSPRRNPGRWPGQARRQDLPARPPWLGDGRGDPRRDRRPRNGRPRAGPADHARSGRRGRLRRGRRRARHLERDASERSRRSGVRILVAEPIAPGGVALLRAHHDVDERPGLSPAELCAILPDYDALVVRSQVQVDAAVIAAGPRLQVIGRAGVGVDNVDLEAATRAGITVVNAPTGNTIAAAEHTLALLYGVARKIAAADASVRRGEWQRTQFTGLELRGRTLGIVGLGKIGQAIAARARAMEMTVLASDPYRHRRGGGAPRRRARPTRGAPGAVGRRLGPRPPLASHARHDRRQAARQDEARSDPAQRRPRRCRGRGGCCRGAHGRASSAGAGIDVFEHEPPTDSPLLDAPNTLLTPHLGASTAEAQVAVAEEVADQVLDVLAGRSARYAVNAPLLTPETAGALAPYLPLAEILGRFFAQFCRSGVRTLTLEIAGELSAFDAFAPDGRGPARTARDLDDRAGQPRQRRRPGEGPRDHGRRAQDARRRGVRRPADACRASREAGRRRWPGRWPAASPG